jgi:hypothetical protein
MPGGAGDGGVAPGGLRAAGAAGLESALRFTAPTPASHDARWTAFVEALMVADSAECSRPTRIVVVSEIRPNEEAQSSDHDRFRGALKVVRSTFMAFSCARVRTNGRRHSGLKVRFLCLPRDYFFKQFVPRLFLMIFRSLPFVKPS